MSGQKEKNGILYGCHVDLSPGEEPDGCVIEYGSHGDCVFAVHESGRKRKSMWTCRHWRPVKTTEKAR